MPARNCQNDTDNFSAVECAAMRHQIEVSQPSGIRPACRNFDKNWRCFSAGNLRKSFQPLYQRVIEDGVKPRIYGLSERKRTERELKIGVLNHIQFLSSEAICAGDTARAMRPSVSIRSISATGTRRRREITTASILRWRMARRTLSTCQPHRRASCAGVKCAEPSVARIFPAAATPPARFCFCSFIVLILFTQRIVACPNKTRHQAALQNPNGKDSQGENGDEPGGYAEADLSTSPKTGAGDSKRFERTMRESSTVAGPRFTRSRSR